MNNNNLITKCLTDNNNILHKLYDLQRTQIQHCNNLQQDNSKLIIKNDNLECDKLVLKRKLEDMEKNSCNYKKEKQNSTKPVQINKYKLINYQPYYKCWSSDKINDIFASIKSIDDIIKLNGSWYFLRHNYKLQRLYNLIPALIKLNEMVGLDNIKKDILKKIIYYIQNNYNNEYLHTIISGPPGVGKTEFAKIYSDIFVRLGILKTSNFMEIKRSDLVGQYLGETSIKTRDLLDSALGGVVFLDEAYSLGNRERVDSFAKESIDMINLYLSEKKGELMFIIAGYEIEIEECFFAYNKGLKRRFHSHYIIPEYKPNELKEIFINKMKEINYNLSVDDKKLENLFIENKNNFQYFGGSIETLCNEIKFVQSLRNFTNNIQNREVIIEDIKNAIDKLNSNKKDNSESRLSMYS
jgi:hypothetical protein